MWQPIETAPKDGTEILIYAPEGQFDSEWNDYEGRWLPLIATVHWNMDHATPDAPDLRDNFTMWAGYYSAFGPIEGKPTHWQPLPEPPTK